MAPEELTSVQSQYGTAETLERLVAAITARGASVIARIDHSLGARSVGLQLRPTLLVIFGNPAVGTALMEANQLMGLDLPLKVLVWEDEDGRTWLSHHELHELASQYALPGSADAVIAKLDTSLRAVVAEASAQQDANT